MADITMCSGVGCPISYDCYRHNAKPDPMWQSYFAEPPYNDGKCEEFWEEKQAINEKTSDKR